MNTEFKLINDDSLICMKNYEEKSIDAIITDPPYGLTYLDKEFDTLKGTPKSGGIFKGKKGGGMKFSFDQNKELTEFLTPFFREAFRILKPGSFLITFSQGRLLLGQLRALEDVGFEIREQFFWRKPSAKPNQQSPTRKNSKIKLTTDRVILGPGKTIEPFIVAQKPKDGSYANNFAKWGTGLIDKNLATTTTWDFPSASKKEKEFLSHLTIKPLDLMKRIVKVFTKEGDVIMDPFNGSGTTGIACLHENRHYVGIEISELFYNESLNRYNREIEKLNKNIKE